MALINTPLRAIQAGRKSRKEGFYLRDMPEMPLEFETDYINGWKLQNIIELHKDQSTRFLVDGAEHLSFGSVIENRNNSRLSVQIRSDSFKTIATLVDQLKLKPDNVVDMALENFMPVAAQLQKEI